MIYELNTLTEAQAVADPKHIWEDNGIYRVYTEGDIPVVETPVIRLNPAQLRLALNQVGLLETVENMVALGSTELKIYWQYSNIFQSDHPLVVQMATQLGQDILPVFKLGESF